MRLLDWLIRIQLRFVAWQMGFMPSVPHTLIESLDLAAQYKPAISPATKAAITRLVVNRRRGTRA